MPLPYFCNPTFRNLCIIGAMPEYFVRKRPSYICVLSRRVKQSGREADYSPPSSAEVKKAWVYTSTFPRRLDGVVLHYLRTRTNLHFYVFVLVGDPVEVQRSISLFYICILYSLPSFHTFISFIPLQLKQPLLLHL
jgi:hypothetical protein